MVLNIGEIVLISKGEIITHGKPGERKTFSFSRFTVDKLIVSFYNEEDGSVLKVNMAEAIAHYTMYTVGFLIQFGIDSTSTDMCILRMYLRGYCQKAIAKKLKVSLAKVSLLLKEYELTTKVYEPI
jgi:hypothetical protein